MSASKSAHARLEARTLKPPGKTLGCESGRRSPTGRFKDKRILEELEPRFRVYRFFSLLLSVYRVFVPSYLARTKPALQGRV